MNRTLENMNHTKNTYAEQDYLVLFFRAVLLFFANRRFRTICTALAIPSIVILTLGIVGGVETGALPLVCMIPPIIFWGLGYLGVYLSRR